jgi:hypothetical protein
LTFDELIRETAIYLDEELTKEGNDYLEVALVNKIKSGLNFAYNKICKMGFIKNTKTIANNYQLEDLVYSVDKIEIDGVSVNFDVVDNKIVYGSSRPAVMTYTHVPPRMLNYTDEPLFPDRIINHTILCYYAAFHVFNIESDSQASQWLMLWNKELSEIDAKRFEVNKIVQVYEM